MTPAARTQAAIELLEAIVTSANEGGAAADTLIARYFATRRYAGSKDRRAVRELVYLAIRTCGRIPSSGRAAMLSLASRHPALKGWTPPGRGSEGTVVLHRRRGIRATWAVPTGERDLV